MAVYVDDMYRSPMGQYRQMKMSHMIADTHDELMRMADRIGLNHQWLQNAGTRREHFDVSMTKRRKAITAGALTVSTRELVELTRRCVTEGLHAAPGDVMVERCDNPALPGKDICHECEWATNGSTVGGPPTPRQDMAGPEGGAPSRSRPFRPGPPAAGKDHRRVADRDRRTV